MFAPVDANGLNAQAINVQDVPCEGAKAVPVSLDFSMNAAYQLNYSNLQQRGFISFVQTIFVDNSQANAGTITITIGGSNQVIVIRPNTQGYYPILMGNVVTITFSSTGSNKAQFFLLNVPVAPGQWSTT